MKDIENVISDLRLLIASHASCEYALGDRAKDTKHAFKMLLAISDDLCLAVERGNISRIHSCWSKFSRYMADNIPTVESFFEDYFRIERRLRLLGFLDKQSRFALRKKGG